MCKLGIILLHYNVVVTYCTALQSIRPVKVVLSQRTEFSLLFISALLNTETIERNVFYNKIFFLLQSCVVWIENVTNGKYINILPSWPYLIKTRTDQSIFYVIPLAGVSLTPLVIIILPILGSHSLLKSIFQQTSSLFILPRWCLGQGGFLLSSGSGQVSLVCVLSA